MTGENCSSLAATVPAVCQADAVVGFHACSLARVSSPSIAATARASPMQVRRTDRHQRGGGWEGTQRHRQFAAEEPFQVNFGLNRSRLCVHGEVPNPTRYCYPRNPPEHLLSSELRPLTSQIEVRIPAALSSVSINRMRAAAGDVRCDHSAVNFESRCSRSAGKRDQ